MDAMGTSSESIENILPSSSNITQEELNIIDPSSIKKELDIDSVPEEFNIVSVFKEEIILPVCKETYVNIMCKEEMNIGLDCKEQVNVGLISNEELQGPSGFKEELTIVDSICKEFNMDSVCENNLHIENENICDNDINISEHVQNENISVNDGDIPERGSQQLKPSTNLMESLETTSDEIETKNTNRRPQRRAASACRRNLSNKAFESESEDDDKLPSDEEEDLDERLEGSDVDTSDSGSSLDSDENATDISQNINMTQKKIRLSLNDKVKVIEANEKDKMSVKQIKLLFKCGQTQIYDTLKNKKKIIDKWMKGCQNMKRKQKYTGNEEMNEILWEWLASARAKNIPISRSILLSHARALAKKLNKHEFKASHGWLECFTTRHCIGWNQICHEAKVIDKATVDDWKQKLSSVVHGFKPRNVFNGGKTGMFFRALPSAHQREKCIKGNMAKERLTVFLCANMIGEMEQPVVIGKDAKPCSFKNLNINKLPVTWQSNKLSFMTVALMEEWLNSFNGKMKRQNRHVILFLANAACHQHIKLSNVKLVWFPPKTTSITQPMSQGVFYTMKTYYRQLVLHSIIVNIETSNNANHLAKSISLLDAIIWIAIACKNIKRDTIVKCFSKAGFPCVNKNPLFEETEEILCAINKLCKHAKLPNNAHAYVTIDNDLATEHTFQSPCELLEQQQLEEQEEKNELKGGEAIEVERKEPAIKTHEVAIQRITELQEFAALTNCSELWELLYKAKDCLEKIFYLKPINNSFENVAVI